MNASDFDPADRPPASQLNLASPIPLYYQIKEDLRRRIETQELPPGTELPSERELCEQYGVSRPTVRQALQELLNAGLIIRRRGMATRVADPKIRHRLGSVLGFSERMEREGRVPSTREIERQILTTEELSPDVVEQLRLAPGRRILRLGRLRMADAEPVLLEIVHLSLDRFPGLEQMDLADHSLYRILRTQYEIEIRGLRETLEPVVLNQWEASLLGTEPGTPAMRAVLTTLDQHGAPLEYTYSLVRGDRCTYYIELAIGEQDGERRARLQQTQLEILI